MTIKRTPRPRDPIQLGKLMVDIATGAVPDAVDDGKDETAAKSGQKGGLKGGKARAAALTPKEKRKIATEAAQIRWENARKKVG
jgi:hypothetical protein